MVAFEHAVRTGFRYLETDVQATRDGVVVAFHDDALDRTTDRSGRISELPYSEVARAKVAGTTPIPTIEELLGTWPEVRVNVDVKADSAIDPLIDTIRRTKSFNRVCVGSFSQHRLDRVRRALGPGLCTTHTPWGVAGIRIASWLGGLVGGPLGRVPCAQVPIAVPVEFPIARVVDRGFIRAAHRLGIQVHVWTIDDAVEMHRLLDLGVDGIMTDEVEVLRDVLMSRGEWHT